MLRFVRNQCLLTVRTFIFFSIFFVLEATILSNDGLLKKQKKSALTSIQLEETIQWQEKFASSSTETENSASINTTYISKFLNELTNEAIYDKRLRPKYGAGAVDVGISIHIISISAVSEVDMDFTLDFYLRQTWYDERLTFEHISPDLAQRIKQLTVGIDYLERLWKPDTFFPNEKSSLFHVATTPNTFLRIEPDGRIFTSQRMTVKAMCPMNLAMFPMDSQTCKLGLESYGYDVDDIDYYWGDRRADGKKPEDAVAFDNFFLPQFRRTGYRVTGTHVRTSSGEYARLYIEVILTRNLGFYMMNIIIPAMLVVSISWVSFWLCREASPARVGLGYITVLTMTTLTTTTNNAMPKVSYIKGLDVFLSFCFVMVFASLVEYAVVSYWNKRQCRRRDRHDGILSSPTGTTNEIAQLQQNIDASNAEHAKPESDIEFPLLMSLPTTPAGGLAVPSLNRHSYVYQGPVLLETIHSGGIQNNPSTSTHDHNGGNSPEWVCGLGDNIRIIVPQTPHAPEELQVPTTTHSAPRLSIISNSSPYMMHFKENNDLRQRRLFSYQGGMSVASLRMSMSTGHEFCRKLWICKSPSKIDRLSRCFFPLLFLFFNLIYWTALTFVSQAELAKEDFVPFDKKQ